MARSTEAASLVCCLACLLTAGIQYSFSVYSPTLRSVLGLNQSQLVLLALAKDVGAYLGVMSGAFFDAYGARKTLLVGGLLTCAGHLCWTLRPHRVACAAWLAPAARCAVALRCCTGRQLDRRLVPSHAAAQRLSRALSCWRRGQGAAGPGREPVFEPLRSLPCARRAALPVAVRLRATRAGSVQRLLRSRNSRGRPSTWLLARPCARSG